MSQPMLADDLPPAPGPVSLELASDASVYGQKASTLALLRKEGHDVPEGFVVPVGGDRSPQVLRVALERLGPGPYAVRSSGVAEDGNEASWAGQFKTFLGSTTPDEVADAVARVVASAGGKTEMAVLVQRLVQPDVAGVMFTKNPTNGDDEVVLEAVAGLADALMDGAADGERWVVVGEQAAPAGEARLLDRALVGRLAALGRSLADKRGTPQDIEWAMAGGRIHVLQARPITGLPLQPQITFPPGRWVKDQSHFTGPVTPIAASVLLPAYEVALEGMFKKFGLPLQTIRQRSYGGEVYTQDVDILGKHDPSAPPPWWVLGIVFRVVPALRRCNTVAAQAQTLLDDFPRKWEEVWRDDCARRIAAARDVDLTALTDDRLLAEFQRTVDEILVPHLGLHFDLVLPNVLGIYELYKCCKQALGWDENQALALLNGLSTGTTRATRDLAAVAALLDDATLAGTLDDVRASSAGLRMEAWLQHWGLRTIDVDPGTPMTAEREDLILVMLREAKGSKPDLGEVAAERQRLVAEARGTMSATHRKRFDAALAYAELVYPQRDDNVPYTEGFPCGLVRRVLLEIGRRLVDRGQLHSPGDTAFLDKGELALALTGALEGASAADRVRRRRAEHAWVSAHPGPAVVGPPLVPDPDLRAVPGPLRRMLEVMMWAMAGELAPPKGGVDEAGHLSGLAVSPGTYTGPVRIVRTESELSRLRPGEVLVCPTTHSSWTVAFGHAGALVTDGGGMLAHPAIIAREHRIPAVLATVCATQRLRDGQMVTVDGGAGKVRIH